MFTLKFYTENDTSGSFCTAIACPKYETSIRPNFVQVLIYKQVDDDSYSDILILAPKDAGPEGDPRTQPTSNRLYQSLFVENSAGKTIDTVRAS